MTLLATRSLKTVTRIEREAGGGDIHYEFLGAKVGDGTVPFESAWLKEVTTYETASSHADIPKDDNALRAIDDIVRDGKTDRLDRYVPKFGAPPALEVIPPGEVLFRL